jgi:hypothetical protein
MPVWWNMSEDHGKTSEWQVGQIANQKEMPSAAGKCLTMGKAALVCSHFA